MQKKREFGMKLKFKKQEYQTRAVDAVVDCFAGQPCLSGINYRIDPGREKKNAQGVYQTKLIDDEGFRNAEIKLSEAQLLKNIQEVQRGQNLPLSVSLYRLFNPCR